MSPSPTKRTPWKATPDKYDAETELSLTMAHHGFEVEIYKFSNYLAMSLQTNKQTKVHVQLRLDVSQEKYILKDSVKTWNPMRCERS